MLTFKEKDKRKERHIVMQPASICVSTSNEEPQLGTLKRVVIYAEELV